MAETTDDQRKHTLDKDLDKLVHVEEATSSLARMLVAPGAGLLFLVLAALVASVYVAGEPRAVLIVAAAAIGGYLALNIGANDVANNVGPAVGAKALTMGGALAMAAIFESAGAFVSGSHVVDTISGGIIARSAVADPDILIRAMMAALVSSALWVNLANWIRAPVSTTHSVVGGVVGAGIVAGGLGAVQWDMMAGIAASWVVSPLLGGLIAAGLLAFISEAIVYRDDKIAAARRWVPLLLAVTAGSFAAFFVDQCANRIMPGGAALILPIGVGVFLAAWIAARRFVHRRSQGMENRNQSLRRLFNLPLIVSAALLSYAHGANDVSNAVGPLAAIVEAAHGAALGPKVAIPQWVMLIGAFGISFGLMIFGSRLIRMVGERITRLNPMRAFCVALSTALTVLVASAWGLPVSSTHTAVGAVFGVGFFREWYTANSRRRRAYLERRNERLRQERATSEGQPQAAVSRKKPVSREEIVRRRLVRRAHVRTIVAAWVTTVPAAALLAAGIFALLGLFA